MVTYTGFCSTRFGKIYLCNPKSLLLSPEGGSSCIHLLCMDEADARLQALAGISIHCRSFSSEQVLLLDEITVDLDVLARADLMAFLKSECEERGATIIYATHIFDGLESWPTHMVCHLLINLQFMLSFLSSFLP